MCLLMKRGCKNGDGVKRSIFFVLKNAWARRSNYI